MLKLLHFVLCAALASQNFNNLFFFEHLKLSPETVGLIGSVNPLLSLVSVPMAVNFSQKIGNKMTLGLLSVLGGVFYLANVWIPVGSSMMVVGMAVLLSMTISPLAPLLDILTLSALDNKQDYGKQRLFGSLSWGIFNALLGFLIDNTGRITVIFYSCFVLLLVFSWLVQMTDHKKETKTEEKKQDAKWTSEMVSFFVTVGCIGTVNAMIGGYLFIFLSTAYEASPTAIGMTTPFSIVFELVIFFYSNQMMQWLGTRNMLILSHLALMLRMLSYMLLPPLLKPYMNQGGLYLILLVEMLHGLSFGSFWSAGMAQVQDMAPESMKASFVGTFSLVSSNVGGILGSLVGGPASIPIIKELIICGINVFRLNFSHIKDPSTQDPIIDEIRKQSDSLAIPVAILGDLGGPKIRCNAFETPSVLLETDGLVNLVAAPQSNVDYLGNQTTIITPVAVLVEQLEVGHRVLLDDGYITLKVQEKKTFTLSGESVHGCVCKIVAGGELKPRKGINVPDLKLNISALTEKDKKDAIYMFEKRLEYVALSFVQKPQDVQDLLNVFHELGGQDKWRPRIISKIEKPQALDVIDDIIQITDGIMVARGDLGVEVSYEQVPVIQKMLISKCNEAGKPMLESMIHSPTPTRAEVSDVANAVFDGTDAVMLSAECAVGEFPQQAVRMMGTICRTAEPNLTYSLAQLSRQNVKRSPTQSVANAAVIAAKDAGATAIVTFTSTGHTAILMSKKRPAMPILAATGSIEACRRLVLYYGVYPLLSDALGTREVDHQGEKIRIPYHRNTDQVLAQFELDINNQSQRQLDRTQGMDLTSTAGKVLNDGDTVVYCAGHHQDFPGLSTTIKLTEFGQALRTRRAQHLWDQAFASISPRSQSPTKLFFKE
ncbi:pyruvate kinase [Gorgonomyces haynaldii]|nr:pyruvate kinase [Gorgonomyces haynaldii]